ncbi:RICIN domain-containing protein [Streptomyces sp. NPDC001941]|uniref:RICIN domain-containing protein n=1 Tax=Streptomyces sp. NPDC001941 TaxID=3154659 RepID=UPI00333143D8
MARTLRAALAVAASLAAVAGAAPTATAADKPHTQLVTANGALCVGASPDFSVMLDECRTDWMFPGVWDAVPAADSTLELRWAGGDLNACLAVENSGTQAGANVRLVNCNGAANTRWQLDLVDPVRKLYQLRPAHTADRCLDVPNSDVVKMKPLQQWTCNQTDAQLWRVKKITLPW